MFDNTNPYTLRTEIVEGIAYYFVSFIDGQAIIRETEVSRPVYLEFQRFVRQERNQHRSDERHIEHSELTEETLHKRTLYPQTSVEETVFECVRNEYLRKVIADLPDIQRRRFILHYEFGLTYEQIANIENCVKMSVYDSVLIAKKKIQKKIKNF